MLHATFVDSKDPDLPTLPDDSAGLPTRHRTVVRRPRRVPQSLGLWEEKHLVRSIYGVAGQVAELADALDLESSGATRQSSSLCLPTSETQEFYMSNRWHRIATSAFDAAPF